MRAWLRGAVSVGEACSSVFLCICPCSKSRGKVLSPLPIAVWGEGEMTPFPGERHAPCGRLIRRVVIFNNSRSHLLNTYYEPDGPRSTLCAGNCGMFTVTLGGQVPFSSPSHRSRGGSSEKFLPESCSQYVTKAGLDPSPSDSKTEPPVCTPQAFLGTCASPGALVERQALDWCLRFCISKTFPQETDVRI